MNIFDTDARDAYLPNGTRITHRGVMYKPGDGKILYMTYKEAKPLLDSGAIVSTTCPDLGFITSGPDDDPNAWIEKQ